jgi:hypothetical protein
VRQAAKDGMQAMDEPTEADGVAAAATHEFAGVEVTKTAPEAQTHPAPRQARLATVPLNEFRR